MTPRISPLQRTVVDEWTQMLGGKASELEMSPSVKKYNFTFPSCTWRLWWGRSHLIGI